MSKFAAGAFATTADGLVCFVCDSGVVGRYYTLASCRTQSTKIRLVEKLGQLVGEDYMVVVSEDDIICRGCATMINSLDRLEKELTSLRSMVLRYLEKKYALAEGELVNARSNVSPKDLVKPESGKNDSIDFTTRKRRAMCGEVDADELKDTKDQMWIQCDRCKYTTSHNLNNAVQAPQTATKTVDKAQIHTPVQRPDVASQPVIIQEMEPPDKRNGDAGNHGLLPADGFGDDDPLANRMEHVTVKKDANIAMEDESVEMITADMAPDFQDDAVAPEVGHVLTLEGGKQVTLQSVEGEDGTNTLCMVDENGMIVQKVEQAEDGTLYVQMPDGSDPTRQMLSLGEDGSVQMVEVLWDDMGHPEDAETHGIVNF